MKSQTYLALHHLFDNGNLFNPKRLVPLVLAGETDEVLAYLPELKPHVEEVGEKVAAEWEQLRTIWSETKDIESQKDFALAIVPKTPFSGLLFQVRKSKGAAQTEADLHHLWCSNPDVVTRRLYG